MIRKMYWCTHCKCLHQFNSVIGKNHVKYAEVRETRLGVF